jgi:hypothetical protein
VIDGGVAQRQTYAAGLQRPIDRQNELVLGCALTVGIDRQAQGEALRLSVVMVISVSWATDAGEWLERRVNSTESVRAHTASGDPKPLAIALTVVVLVLLGRELLAGRARRQSTPVAMGAGPGTTRTRSPGSDRSDTVAPWGGRGIWAASAAMAKVIAV